MTIDINKWQSLFKFIIDNLPAFILGAVVAAGVIFPLYEKVVLPGEKIIISNSLNLEVPAVPPHPFREHKTLTVVDQKK